MSGEYEKAQAILAMAEKHNWNGVISAESANEAILQLKRGEEILEFGWRDRKWLGLFGTESCWYSLAGGRRNIRNASEAKRYITGQPDYKRKTRRVKPKAEDGEMAEQEIVRNLPWDDEASDKEILKACYGRKLIWRNSITGFIEEAVVTEAYRDSHGRYHKANFDASIYKITRSRDGRAALRFVSSYGFRAVSLDNLLVVK